MAQRILKNNTASAVVISDTGYTVPASGQLVIPPQIYGLFEGSADVLTYVTDKAVSPDPNPVSTLTVNDGTYDLQINEGVRLIQGGFSRTIADKDDPTVKAAVTSGQSSSEFNNRLTVETIMAGLDSLAVLRRINSVVRSDGLTAMAVDSRTVVESTFGFDQNPDSFFRIVNTGSAGCTWTIYIAGTSNDPSTPDRDLPPYTKIFTIQAGEVGDEIALRDRIIQELNADSTFKQTLGMKAQKATDRSIVHILSDSFSLSGEFYERPNAGDFSVTIGGTPSDGVVVVGFDNLISRSKPVSISRDFDSPHRLGLFGITGQVQVTAKDLDDLFIENATLNADNVTTSMLVNGSLASPKIFEVPAQTTTDVFIEEIRFYGRGNGIKYNNFLSQNSPLTNGLEVHIKSDNTITSLPVIKNTADFKNKFSFGQGASGFSLDITVGEDEFLAVFDFNNPFILRVEGTFSIDDYIQIHVHDNLTSGISEFEFIAKGFEKEP